VFPLAARWWWCMIARILDWPKGRKGTDTMPRIAAALAVVATVGFCIGFNVARYPVVFEMARSGDRVAPSEEPAESTAFPQVAHAGQSDRITEPATTTQAPTEPTAEPSAGTGWEPYGGSTAGEPIAAYPGDAEADGSSGWTDGAPVVAAISGQPADASSPTSAESPEPPEPPGFAAMPDDQPARVDSPPAAAGSPYPEEVIGYPTSEPIEVLPSMKYGSSAADPPVEAAAEEPVESHATEATDAGRALVPVIIPEEARQLGDSPDVRIAANPQGPGEQFATDAAVQRLPPIDEVWTDPAAGEAPLLQEDPIPIYPTTGIE